MNMKPYDLSKVQQDELDKHVYSKLQCFKVYDLDNSHWAFSDFHQVWIFLQFAEALT
jgi:hypothetical protein